jgi:hypothetical protein
MLLEQLAHAPLGGKRIAHLRLLDAAVPLELAAAVDELEHVPCLAARLVLGLGFLEAVGRVAQAHVRHEPPELVPPVVDAAELDAALVHARLALAGRFQLGVVLQLDGRGRAAAEAARRQNVCLAEQRVQQARLAYARAAKHTDDRRARAHGANLAHAARPLRAALTARQERLLGDQRPKLRQHHLARLYARRLILLRGDGVRRLGRGAARLMGGALGLRRGQAVVVVIAAQLDHLVLARPLARAAQLRACAHLLELQVLEMSQVLVKRRPLHAGGLGGAQVPLRLVRVDLQRRL